MARQPIRDLIPSHRGEEKRLGCVSLLVAQKCHPARREIPNEHAHHIGD